MDLFDVEAIEVAEAQLDQFIERRAREARDAELVEVAWAADFGDIQSTLRRGAA